MRVRPSTANFYLRQGRKNYSSAGGSKRRVGTSPSITSNSPIPSCGRSAQNCPRCIASQIVIQDRDLCDSRGLPIERNAHAVSLRPSHVIPFATTIARSEASAARVTIRQLAAVVTISCCPYSPPAQKRKTNSNMPETLDAMPNENILLITHHSSLSRQPICQ